jgi:hypothetical protein
MINLNDASFDASEGKAIFNGGNAGIAENVSLSISKKKPEDKEGSPDYKLTFTDENGGACNSSYWYVEKATEYSSIDEQIAKQGKVMKHVIHAIYGNTYQFPNFNSAKEMLDGCMKIIRDGLSSNPKFRVFANYGTNSSVKNYIQPRSWVPFVEPMSVDIADTRLKPGNLDAMAKMQADTIAVSSSAAAAPSIDGDDW